MSEIPTEILLPTPQTQFEKDLCLILNERFREIAEAINENVILPSGGACYFGDTEVDGSWRLIRNGNNLVVQRLESSSWVTKSTFTA